MTEESMEELGRQMGALMAEKGSSAALHLLMSRATAEGISRSGLFLELPEDPNGDKISNLRKMVRGAILFLQEVEKRL